MACRCLVGLPCVCKIPVETCSVGVDQQEFDAAGLGVGTAAGGLFGLAHDDAFGRDAFGDESITDAKGALLGKVAVEGGVTGGVVVAGQQDVAAIGGVEGFDDGGDDGCVFSGDVGRCRGEVNDTRDFGGTFDIEGNDAGHKITIMSALAFGTPVNFQACYLEGISKLDSRDIKYAEELGYRINLQKQGRLNSF